MPTLFPVEQLVPKLLDMAQTILSVDWKTSVGKEYDETVEELTNQLQSISAYLDMLRDDPEKEETI